MHFENRQDAQKSFHSLKVGDTFDGQPCHICGVGLTGYYQAAGFLKEQQHPLEFCVKQLAARIAELESPSSCQHGHSPDKCLFCAKERGW